MLEHAEQQAGKLIELLKDPTPESFEAVNQELAGLATALQAVLAEPSAKEKWSMKDSEFLSRLPAEMAHVRLLLQAPINFLEGLALFRTQKFGSYNRQGQMEGIGLETLARTSTHL